VIVFIMAKGKARRRALEQKRGTTAHDPFIPARNARPLPTITNNPIIQKYHQTDEEPANGRRMPSTRRPAILWKIAYRWREFRLFFRRHRGWRRGR
jgi:hypothetical protein